MIREPAQNKAAPALTQLTSGKKATGRWSRDRQRLACPTPVSTRARSSESTTTLPYILDRHWRRDDHACMCTNVHANLLRSPSLLHMIGTLWSLVAAACTCPFVRAAAASSRSSGYSIPFLCRVPGWGRTAAVFGWLAGRRCRILLVARRLCGRADDHKREEARGQPPPGRGQPS